MPKLSGSDKAAKVSSNEARRRKEVALAGMRELELSKMQESLLDADKVQAFWTEQCARLSQTMLAIPDRVAEALVRKDAAAIRVRLREEIEEALRGLVPNVEN